MRSLAFAWASVLRAASNARDAVPCWVREMDDEAAYMALVTSNSQGELSPLEIGMHALNCVDKAQGKRGGGLTAYASATGKDESYIRQIRKAAEVFVASGVNSEGLQTKTQHLAAIHSLPRECWPAAVQTMFCHDLLKLD